MTDIANFMREQREQDKRDENIGLIVVLAVSLGMFIIGYLIGSR